METFEYVKSVCEAAAASRGALASASTAKKNAVLARIASLLREESGAIIAANADDLANADANGVPKPMLDRLKLDEKRIGSIADSLGELIMLEDPIGSVTGWG